MCEQLLYKSSKPVITEYLVDALKSNGILCRKHNEKASQRTGAYGPDEGMAIYVQESDYEKALEIIRPIIAAETNPTASALFCPQCGAEDITPLPNPACKYRSGLIISSIILLLLPLVYFGWNFTIYKIAFPAGNILATLSLILAFILMFLSGKSRSPYRCRTCGKTFYRD